MIYRCLCWLWCNSLSLWSQCFFFFFTIFSYQCWWWGRFCPQHPGQQGRLGYNILHSLRYPKLETILLFDIFMSTSPWISNTDHYYFEDLSSIFTLLNFFYFYNFVSLSFPWIYKTILKTTLTTGQWIKRKRLCHSTVQWNLDMRKCQETGKICSL